jgi:hypothetical protein
MAASALAAFLENVGILALVMAEGEFRATLAIAGHADDDAVEPSTSDLYKPPHGINCGVLVGE